MTVNIQITIIKLNALHMKRRNLSQEHVAVMRLLMDVQNCEYGKFGSVTRDISNSEQPEGVVAVAIRACAEAATPLHQGGAQQHHDRRSLQQCPGARRAPAPLEVGCQQKGQTPRQGESLWLGDLAEQQLADIAAVEQA